MTAQVRNVFLIGRTLLYEAWRRREVYAIVLITSIIVGALRFVHFFDIPELSKFYREIALKVMNVTTAATVILLAARQLPREFANRTIYPLLAKPVSRLEFLVGKFLGVVMAGVFCYALFMAVFVTVNATLQVPVEKSLFLQSVYLQILQLSVVASLVFLLSMVLNTDAAITLAAILYLFSQTFMNLTSYLYDYVDRVGQWFLVALMYAVPQITLFDASAKAVHSVNRGETIWHAMPAWVLYALTGYAAAYSCLFLAGAYLLFRRRPL
ncbi:ABC transporter permease subunit [Candidatus Sumerlaeota bacterium]|nr:ABC transporter permease subunit [Candidatus Sumerlaeota bacterium]